MTNWNWTPWETQDSLFVIISTRMTALIFVAMVSQLFNLLCDKADDVYGGRLPYHVRLLLDEFSNIGQIPKLDKLIATIRSVKYPLPHSAVSEPVKTIYKDAPKPSWKLRYMLFLGGKELHLKGNLGNIGKETIDLYNRRPWAEPSHPELPEAGKDVPYLLVTSSVALNIMNRDTINWIRTKTNTGGRHGTFKKPPS